MSSAVPRSFRSSASLRIEEELMGDEPRGIGSILGFSKQRTERRQSLRRTFSADMSSKKWLGQNLPLSLKKIASTEEFSTISAPDTSSASSSEDEEEKKERRKAIERPAQFDIWSSIQSQNTTNSNSLLNTPYIHPLVRRTSSSLSEKSLMICTESLGSETGSDDFSSLEDQDYFASDGSDDDEEENEVVQDKMQDSKKELVAVNYNCCVSKRSPTCSFPPPLPSISRRDGPCLQMRPHRRDGRLVVEAVPVPSHNYLHAHRQGGRLRLSFINSPSKKESHIPPQQQESEEVQEEEEEAQEEEVEVVVDRGIVLEMKVKHQEEVMRLSQSMPVMNKLMASMKAMHLNNPNPWMDKKIDGGDDRDEPRRGSRLLEDANFNGCDRWWKRVPMAHYVAQGPPNKVMVPMKPLVLKAKDLLPVTRCKETLWPVLVWKPSCIATT